MHNSDLIIIGAGPGGYETALAAAKRGLDVTLFEGANLGGTCLNEGCIPTKCLCRNAEILTEFKEGAKFGIDDFEFSFDFNKVIDRKNEVVDSLKQGIDSMLKAAKVNVINAFASFKDSKTIIANNEEYTATDIIISTGSISKSLPIDGADADFVMNSTQLLNIDRIPESLVIVGGGVIGMEFASIFNAVGSKVTVIEFMNRILPPFDADISKRLKQNLSKKGINILTSAAVKKIEKNADGEILTTYEFKGKENTVTSTDILMAVGRAPRIDGLNLEATGVEFSKRGIVVDDNMQTSIEHIYAIGDVNAKMMLAHVATFQGLRALNKIQGLSDSINFNVVPSAVFTYPECGMVGLTEEQCKEQERNIKIGQSFFRANGKSLALGEPDGLCKLIFDADSQKLIGAHLMGVQSADLAQQAANMISAQTTIEQMQNLIFGHPTVSEVLLSAVHNIK